MLEFSYTISYLCFDTAFSWKCRTKGASKNSRTKNVIFTSSTPIALTRRRRQHLHSHIVRKLWCTFPRHAVRLPAAFPHRVMRHSWRYRGEGVLARPVTSHLFPGRTSAVDKLYIDIPMRGSPLWISAVPSACEAHLPPRNILGECEPFLSQVTLYGEGQTRMNTSVHTVRGSIHPQRMSRAPLYR